MFSFINIYDSFKEIATKHRQINTFGFGDVWEIATSGTITYPMLFVVPDGAVSGRGQVGNKFKVLVMDKVILGESNENDVLSDTQQILLDVISILKDGGYDFHLKQENISIEDFTERFTEDVTGWSADLVLWVPYSGDRCAIPTSQVFTGTPGGLGGTVTTFCAKVDECLGISTAGSASKYLDEKGNFTAPPAGLGVYRNLWIPASAMTPRVTNGAAGATEEYATNDIMLEYFLFDTTTEEAVQFLLAMPDEWDASTMKAKVYWDAATGASAADLVSWGIKAGALSNDDAIDAALGSQVVIDDVVIAVGDLHISPATAAITVGGSPALGDMCIFQIVRNVGGNDNMTEDAKLLGVMLQYKESTTEPSAW